MGGNLRLPASGCPLSLPKGAIEVPQPLLSLGDPTSAEQARRGLAGPREEGAQRSKIDRNRTGLQLSKIVISTVSRGQEPNPREGVPVMASFTL